MKLERNNKEAGSANIAIDSFMGTTHASNEDEVLAVTTEHYTILAVFDGVGSAKNNALATSLSKKFISNKHGEYYVDSEFRLEEMVSELNNRIISHPQSDSSALSTCAVCVYICHNNTLVFLSLGDTRIYAIGKHYVTKITEDDVIFPGSNTITRCLGIELDNEDISQVIIPNFKDDILICSDGFYKIFEDTKVQFFDAFLKKRVSSIKNSLQTLVKDKNTDDASYVLFKNV